MSKCEIIFFGDYAPVRKYEPLAIDIGENVFGGFSQLIKEADLSFVNLEAPLCKGGKAIMKNGPHLRAHPNCIRPLKEVGFKIIGLANNHIMDYGPEGLKETMALCEENGLKHCGAGKNLDEARQPLIVECRGRKVAFIVIAEHEFSIATDHRAGAAPVDVIENLKSIRAAKEVADHIVVSIHGGNEYFSLPRPGLRRLAHFFVDEGVDAVICHHAHVPGAYEVYNGKPIVYSLGNFIFDRDSPPQRWDEGYVLKLTVGRGEYSLCDFEIIPYRQSVAIGGVHLLSGSEREEFLERMNTLNAIMHDPERYDAAWKHFCESRAQGYLNKLLTPFSFRGSARLFRMSKLNRLLLSKGRLLALKNIIDCESHLEVLSESIDIDP